MSMTKMLDLHRKRLSGALMWVALALSPTPSLAVEPAPVLDVTTLSRHQGFVLKGAEAGDGTGWSVGRLGDVNGDGVEDIIISARFAHCGAVEDAGKVYVVFGRRGGFTSPVELSALNGRDGFVLEGIDAQDYAGHAVTGVGDVNGDGVDDFLVGAISADPDGLVTAGEAYLVFGHRWRFPPVLKLSTLDGVSGVLIKGLHPDGDMGGAVAGAGDVNGDGISDLIITAAHSTPTPELLEAGEVFVVFGHTGPWSGELNVGHLSGFDGFAFRGGTAVDHTGFAASIIGDVNHDGLADIVIGAFASSPANRPFAGQAYVVFGSRGSFPPVLDPSALNGSNGFVLRGANPGDLTGSALTGLGDVNGDGVDDFAISAPFASPDGRINAGLVYVLYGVRSRCSPAERVVRPECSRTFPPLLELSTIDGTNGFVLKGAAAADLTATNAHVGDVNGDGVNDLLVGASGAQPTAKAYVVFGRGGRRGPGAWEPWRRCRRGPQETRAPTFPAVVDLGALAHGEGIVFSGMLTGDVPGLLEYGSPSAGTGDVNQDGLEDILLGSRLASPDGKTSAGAAYVVYGACNLGDR